MHTASDGFLDDPASTTTLSRTALHASRTLRAFDGAWDDTSEQDAKEWCDECLRLIRASGEVFVQHSGAIMLASVVSQLAASPDGIVDSIYARCADGIVWLVKHCRATSLRGSVGLAGLEAAAFKCVDVLFRAIASPTSSSELRKSSTPLLSEIMPQLTSMLSLGTAGVTDATSLQCLLRTTSTALILFENQMRPYLGPLRGALVRARMFVGAPSHILSLSSRCWSLVVSARSRTQKPTDDSSNKTNVHSSAVGTSPLLEVPAHFWQEECLRIVYTMHDLLLLICPAAGKTVGPEDERLFRIESSEKNDGDRRHFQPGMASTKDGATDEVSLSERLEMLSYLLSAMLSSGPTGPPGVAMLAIVPVVEIVDLLVSRVFFFFWFFFFFFFCSC